MRRAGVSVLLSSCINICGFLSAAVIPIPALRALAFQVSTVEIVTVKYISFVCAYSGEISGKSEEEM